MAIYLIVLMCTLNHAGFGGSRVLVSLYALELGANQFAIGVLMALYGLCPMLLAVSIGKLADRIGPRLPMLMGTAGISVALILPPLFPGPTTLYFSALLIGTSFHFFFVTVTGIAGGIGGRGKPRPQLRAGQPRIFRSGFPGTHGGGIFDRPSRPPAHLRAPRLIPADPPAAPLVQAGISPPAGRREAADGRRNALDLWRIPVLRNTFIASGIISSAWDLFQFYLPVYGYSIGLSASAIGTVLGVFAFATFMIRIVLPRLIVMASEAAILTYAIFVAAFAFVLFPFFQHAAALAAIAFLLGLGCGCGQPLSMSLIYALSPPGRVSESDRPAGDGEQFRAPGDPARLRERGYGIRLLSGIHLELGDAGRRRFHHAQEQRAGGRGVRERPSGVCKKMFRR